MSLKGNVDVLSVHIQGCGDGYTHTHTSTHTARGTASPRASDTPVLLERMAYNLLCDIF